MTTPTQWKRQTLTKICKPVSTKQTPMAQVPAPQWPPRQRAANSYIQARLERKQIRFTDGVPSTHMSRMEHVDNQFSKLQEYSKRGYWWLQLPLAATCAKHIQRKDPSQTCWFPSHPLCPGARTRGHLWPALISAVWRKTKKVDTKEKIFSR